MTIDAFWSVSFATASERGSAGIALLRDYRIRGELPGMEFEGWYEFEDNHGLHVEVTLRSVSLQRAENCRVLLYGRPSPARIELSGHFLPRASRAITVLLHNPLPIEAFPMTRIARTARFPASLPHTETSARVR